MRRQKLFFLLFVLISLISCNKNDGFLNGEVFIVDKPTTLDTLKHESHIVYDGLYSGALYAYDSLVLFSSSKFPEKYLNIFSQSSKTLLGSFFRVGNGPNEVIDFVNYGQFFKYKGDLMLWVCINSLKMVPFNITQSLKSGNTILQEDVVNLTWKKDLEFPFLKVYVLDSSTYITRNQSPNPKMNNNEFISGEYRIYNSQTNRLARSIKIFKKGIVNKFNDIRIPVEQYYSSSDAIKPDGSKLAMGMLYVSQINILDVKTGVIKGFRLRNTPDFEYLESDPDKFKLFNFSITADDNYIYVPYIDAPFNKGMGIRSDIHILHLYDWEGNLVKQLYLDHPIYRITIDPVNKKLYSLDKEDEMYSYNLSDL